MTLLPLEVLELHGSVWRNFCMDCGAPYTVEELLALREQSPDGVPRCTHCGAIVKPPAPPKNTIRPGAHSLIH